MQKILLLIVGVLIPGAASQGPTVDTEYGQLRGKVLSTPKGQCNAFLGVPFAAPPVGDLRWQKPQSMTKWTGVRAANAHAAVCVQPSYSNGNYSLQKPQGSEDCLYLNVFAPKSATASSKKPVMVFLHGGAFMIGSAREYGDDGPCENLVASRDVVLVIPQYRLGVYGFLGSGDSAAPGNYWLWDQIAALQWVSKNIQKFGGDPKRVTVFGESAGGASVSALTYVSQAKDLYNQAIIQSGSATPWFPLEGANTPINRFMLLATLANCLKEQSSDTVACLRQLSTAQLQQLPDAALGYYPIAADGELFTGDALQESTPGKPTIIGANSLEMPPPDKKNIPIAQTLLTQTMDGMFNGSNAMQNQILKQVVSNAYFDSQGDPNNNTFVVQQLARLGIEQGFHAQAAAEASAKAAAGQPVWVYNFDYWSDNAFPKDFPFKKGGPHAHELCYMFLLRQTPGTAQTQYLTCPTAYTGPYRQMADTLAEMWTNFAKTGDPSPKALRWPKFQSLTKASAMTIRSKLSIEPQFFLQASTLWNQLIPKIKEIVGN